MRWPDERLAAIVVTAHFRFYAELNDFLAPMLRQRRFSRVCSRDASVKHMIEAFGVPHTEVELILVNGEPVNFSHRLRDGERVSVYPCFATLAIAAPLPLRPPAPGKRFIADAHLGQLAKQLRMLGFDVLYRNDYSDAELARIAAAEGRIVLTRDRDLLIRKEIVHGCYLHALNSDEQVREVVRRFDLVPSVRALSRCLSCNGVLRVVEKSEIEHRVPPYSRDVYEQFYECDCCAQVYWEGSHVVRMRARVERMLRHVDENV
jgi:uncharacterized protein